MAFIEHTSIHDGMIILTTIDMLGHRCGYVGVPEDYKYSDTTVDIGSYIKNLKELLNKKTICNEISVHGGITAYECSSEWPVETDETFIWLGFDTMHYGDNIDYDKAIENAKEFGEYETDIIEIIDQRVEQLARLYQEQYPDDLHTWTTDEVVTEAIRVADQISNIVSAAKLEKGNI